MHTLGDTPLTIRRMRRARNYTLSYNHTRGEALLTLPLRASLKAGLAFAESRAGWLQTTKAEFPAKESFYPNITLPVLGERLTFTHKAGRGLPEREGNAVVMRGDEAFFARRVRDWLKIVLTHALTCEVTACVAQLGVKKNVSIQVKTMSSRWGSCAPDGTLVFSSRLVFAPPTIVRYLAAHECAHLVHANHGPRFWTLVATLYPEFDAARRWLRAHGRELSRFG